jgi:hypothetical protein
VKQSRTKAARNEQTESKETRRKMCSRAEPFCQSERAPQKGQIRKENFCVIARWHDNFEAVRGLMKVHHAE